MTSDKERNRLTARVQRYGRVGANVGGVAARIASTRLLGLDPDRDGEASALAAALGGLKGPIMKVAQLLATIPEALPAEYVAELGQLQSQAPQHSQVADFHTSIEAAVSAALAGAAP